ncbi:hypothetical protein HD597_003783 [Nonomuraea thailandensis]|uniref:Uncharacterized protein n=1 Tax=Nonomuraea thailandensis TaxID=1188745 RepID=A0A9X2GLI8_9ACTN|nr:hypothetical protein [Nonomuraea thailandensis]MCP2356763.1 hypothetical protein [Nonomuraea thailandensis]
MDMKLEVVVVPVPDADRDGDFRSGWYGEREARPGAEDLGRLGRYAGYLVREQAGSEVPA